MKRKIVSGFMAAMATTVLMASAVMAAPSVSSTQEIITSTDTVKSDSVITVGGEALTVTEAVAQNKVEIKFHEPTSETFVNAGVAQEVVNEILSINNEPEKAQAVLEAAIASTVVSEEDKVEASTLSMLTSVQELAFVDKATGEVIKDAKNVTLTWRAPITSNMNVDNVRVLHYSIAKGAWELIKPSAVNPLTGEITAFFTDLSPVAIVYVDEEKVNAGGETEKPTETPSNGNQDSQQTVTDNTATEENGTVNSDTSATDESKDTGTSTVNTGDNNNIVLYVVLAAAACCAVGGLVIMRKKRA